MTQEQADKFWEPLFAISAYAKTCTDKLEKVLFSSEGEKPPQRSTPDSQKDARSTILTYLPKIKERITEIEELLLTKEGETKG